MRKLPFIVFSLALLLQAAACKKDNTPAPANNADVVVPTAFSPNGDQLNDIFIVQGPKIMAFSLSIYSSDNHLLFRTEDINTGWDGTFNGKPMPAASYLWVIAYQNAAGEKHNRSGYVELLR